MTHSIRVFSLLLSLVLLLGLLSGCAPKTERYEKKLFAMDTVISFTLYTDHETANTAYKRAADRVRSVESVISRTDPDSTCSALNREVTDLCYPDEEFCEVLGKALSIAEATDGLFDPTVAALTDLWKINDEHAEGIPTDEEIAAARTTVGWEGLTVTDGGIEKKDPATKVDLGGIGKGYAAAEAIETLRIAGVQGGILSFGGNVAVFGKKPDGTSFSVGIRDPEDETGSGTLGILHIDSGFVSVSGSYERYRDVDGVRYHHIFDPRTGYPSESGLVSVAVWSEDGAAADAYSTALFVAGFDEGRQLLSRSAVPIEAIFICGDGSVIPTPGIAESFSLSSDRYTVVPFDTDRN